MPFILKNLTQIYYLAGNILENIYSSTQINEL